MTDGRILVLLSAGLLAGVAAVREAGSRGIARSARVSGPLVRRDQRSYRFYVVNWDRRGGWPVIESGFPDKTQADVRSSELGRRLPSGSQFWAESSPRERPVWRVVSRSDLSKAGFAPAGKFALNLWMSGKMVDVDPQSPPVDQVRDAVHNVSLWTFGRPFEHGREAIVETRGHQAAFEWAPESDVVVFKEYGLPQAFAWWRIVEAELDVHGSPLHYEFVNDAVIAFVRN